MALRPGVFLVTYSDCVPGFMLASSKAKSGLPAVLYGLFSLMSCLYNNRGGSTNLGHSAQVRYVAILSTCKSTPACEMIKTVRRVYCKRNQSTAIFRGIPEGCVPSCKALACDITSSLYGFHKNKVCILFGAPGKFVLTKSGLRSKYLAKTYIYGF